MLPWRYVLYFIPRKGHSATEFLVKIWSYSPTGSTVMLICCFCFFVSFHELRGYDKRLWEGKHLIYEIITLSYFCVHHKNRRKQNQVLTAIFKTNLLFVNQSKYFTKTKFSSHTQYLFAQYLLALTVIPIVVSSEWGFEQFTSRWRDCFVIVNIRTKVNHLSKTGGNRLLIYLPTESTFSRWTLCSSFKKSSFINMNEWQSRG